MECFVNGRVPLHSEPEGHMTWTHLRGGVSFASLKGAIPSLLYLVLLRVCCGSTLPARVRARGLIHSTCHFTSWTNESAGIVRGLLTHALSRKSSPHEPCLAYPRFYNSWSLFHPRVANIIPHPVSLFVNVPGPPCLQCQTICANIHRYHCPIPRGIDRVYSENLGQH